MVKRLFRGVELQFHMTRDAGVTTTEIYVNGNYIEDGIIRDLKSDVEYKVLVKIPF